MAENPVSNGNGNNNNSQGAAQPQPQPQAQPAGMKVNVTPQSPVGPKRKPSPFDEEYGQVHKKNAPIIGIAIVIVFVLFGIIYVFVLPNYFKTSTTTSIMTTSTTTVPSGSGYLSGCGNITTPGTYTLAGNIKTSRTTSACIDIAASNVTVECKGYSIVGSGPFSALPPFSYGIKAVGVRDVNVHDCAVSNFSYGMYAMSVDRLNASQDNFTTNYLANLFMSATSNSTVAYSHISNSGSLFGGLNVTNHSSNNKFINDSLLDNVFYGAVINSTGNRFINNSLNGAKYDFYCSASAGLLGSNYGSNNKCENDSGCDFINSCLGINIPANISQISLQSVVDSCGTISNSGSYSMAGNLNVQSFSSASPSKLQHFGIPCIRIVAANVQLNCNGHAISNAFIGIAVHSANVLLSNCGVSNSITGILVGNASSDSLRQINLMNDTTGLSLFNTTSVTATNVIESAGTYGFSLASTEGAVIRNFTANLNAYGIYLSGSLGNIFNNGRALSNSKLDVYATPDSSNTNSNLMGATICNVTNAQWAPCSQHTSGSSNLFPLDACSNINRPGIYSMSQNIAPAGQKCMTVSTSNVVLDCGRFTVFANSGTPGPAIYVNGRNNVTVSNCTVTNYAEVLAVQNSTDVRISNVSGYGIANYGVYLSNDVSVTLSGGSSKGVANATLVLSGVRGSTITGYNATGLQNVTKTGIVIQNSTDNMFSNNYGSGSFVGVYFQGKSTNNTFSNNTFSSNSRFDYQCDPQDSNLSSENGGINTGSSKSGCHWLAAIPAGSAPLQCALNDVSQLYFFSQDYSYSTGTTCFTSDNGNTTINCDGHTIIATQGGTFASLQSPVGSNLENCYLKGFTKAAVIRNAPGQVRNNTIYNGNGLVNATTAEINVTNSIGARIIDNNITTLQRGIYLNRAKQGVVKNNRVNAAVGYYLSGENGTQINNNTAEPGTGIAAELINASSVGFQNNLFNGLTNGFICLLGAQASGTGVDNGGNRCSSNTNCGWMTQSSAGCPLT